MLRASLIHRFPFAAILCALLLADCAAGQTNPPAAPTSLPPIVPANRPSIGIALEGGGALGLAHIGVLQWMEEHRIPVDRITGTSMGALVGAFYASGYTPAAMIEVAEGNAFQGLFTLQTPYAESSFRRRQDRREMPESISLGLRNGVSLRNAVLLDRGVNQFLSTYLITYNREHLDYNQLPIPFRCVATDLTSLQPLVFDHGPLVSSVRASISIPGVFPPVQDARGHYLVDGGILDNLPTDVLSREFSPSVILAVRLEDSPIGNSDTSSIVGVLNRAFSAAIAQNVEKATRLANVVISVPVGQYSGADYGKAAVLIATGYRAAEANRAALLPYALDEAGWNAYLADRNSRQLARHGNLQKVSVEGGDPDARQQVLADLKALYQHPLDVATINKGLQNIQSNGGYTATYTTFREDAGSGVLVHLGKDPIGPPYLLVGMDLAASTGNIAHMTSNFRLVDQNFGGFGSELRINTRLGYLTDLSAEYYRLLTPGGYFLQPSVRLLRAPVYIWANQQHIAEHFQQQRSIGLEFGRTFNNQMQLSASWHAELTDWNSVAGTIGGSPLSGSAQSGQIDFTLDDMVSGIISPRGIRIHTSLGTLYHAVGSDNAPVIKMDATRNWQWGQKNIFALGGELDSYLRTSVAEPYRFTLGGPLRLSASSFDEYRGTDTFLTHAVYLHRISALPTGLGEGLYGAISYQSGQIWSPENSMIVRQDGSFGILASTPFGAITGGFAIGDAGRRKIFITLGRLF